MNLKSLFGNRKTEYKLQNVVETNREFPRTFLIPEDQHISSIEVGSLVKLIFIMKETAEDGCRAERMWVRIQKIQGNSYIGVLDNDPYYLKTVKAGTEIKFCRKHIAEIYVSDIGFDEEKIAILTKRAFDERQINWVVRSVDLYNEQDSGWQLFYGDEDDEYLNEPSNSMVVSLKNVLTFEPLLEEVFRSNGSSYEYDSKKNCFVKPKF